MAHEQIDDDHSSVLLSSLFGEEGADTGPGEKVNETIYMQSDTFLISVMNDLRLSMTSSHTEELRLSLLTPTIESKLKAADEIASANSTLTNSQVTITYLFFSPIHILSFLGREIATVCGQPELDDGEHSHAD